MRLSALRDAPYAFGSTYEREVVADGETWRTRLKSRTQFVAELDAVAVGTAGGYLGDASTPELVSMWVAPHARGKGAGDALVLAVVAWARDAGFATLRLWVAEGNTQAENLYARHGFERTGDVKPIRAGEPRMEFRMSLRLV